VAEPRDETARVDAAVSFLRARVGEPARLGLVLGSGLRDFAKELEGRTEVAMTAVPGWPSPRVEGHGGSLVAGELGGLRVFCLTGRVHLYEGFSPAEVVRAVRTLARLGVDTVVLTNAAGGIAEGLLPGDLMVLRDHLNLTGCSPLVGPAEPALGPRFPDQSAVYDRELASVLRAVDAGLREGVYAGLLGPSYETPAEVRMLRVLGADAVGMSTVAEAIALNALGVRVAAVSLISNLAAGISSRPLAHDEVVEAGRRASGRLAALLTGFCARMAAG
jgi:purine-nucleoside phosphorylase